jgi:translation initiation factor 1
MGEVIQLQGDQRNKIKDFLCDKDNGLGLDEKTIKVRTTHPRRRRVFKHGY